MELQSSRKAGAAEVSGGGLKTMIRKEVDALTLARDVGYVPELWKEDTVLFTSMSGPTVLVTLRNEVAVDAKVDMAGSPITDDSDEVKNADLSYSTKKVSDGITLIDLVGADYDDEDWDELLAKNMHFAELSSGCTNQTELIALLIIQGKTFKEGIENVFDRIKGSCSMLILTEDGIIAARDKWGRTPVVIGKKDGAHAVTSESCSFPNLDYEIERYIGPGEIVRILPDSIEEIRPANEKMQICSFLWVYYGFPTSSYEDRNVEQVRFTSGLKMGQKDTSEADCVCGIPDSGIGQGLGYAEGKGIPYHRAITKYTPTWPRSFTPSNQERRNLVAKMKLIPNRAMLEGKRVIFCDDSIVRGTQLRDNVKILFDYGAKEVHMRIGCPPLVYGCPFLGFSASKTDMELITRRIIKEFEGDGNKNTEKYSDPSTPEYRRMVDRIAAEFGLTSLKFNTIETLIEAIGLPKCQVCTHCFDGSSSF